MPELSKTVISLSKRRSGRTLFNNVADWCYGKHAGVDLVAHVLELADLDGLGKQITKQTCPGK